MADLLTELLKVPGRIFGDDDRQRIDQDRVNRARERTEQRNVARNNVPSMYSTGPSGNMILSNNYASALYDSMGGSNNPDNPFDFNGPEPAGSNGPGGGGSAPLRPVYLPRLQGPSEAELAQLAFNAVAAARMPYDAQRQNLAMGRTQGQAQIAAADRDARTATAAAYNQWRAATSDLDNRVGGVYDAAARNLAQNMSIANESMLARGFRPQAVNPEILLAMQSLGANARNYAVNRRAAGEDAARQDATGVGQITQAAQGTLANTYALVLGQIAQQSAASEAQARLDAENRIFALRREIEQLNNQTAIQEALANSGR